MAMKSDWRSTTATVVVTTALGVVSLTGCGNLDAGEAPVDVDAAILQSCPTDKDTAFRAAIDLSGTRITEPLSNAEEAAIRSAVQRVAVCGGPLEITAFDGTVATTTRLYGGTPHLDGATDTAKLRREPALTDSVMATTNQGLERPRVARSVAGSDILGQVAQSAEYRGQIDPSGTTVQMSVLIVSDGIDNEQLQLDDPSLTREAAIHQADIAAVPDLTGVDFTMIGVGRTSSGTVAGTPYVDALKAAWSRICERSHAASCTVVTDPASGQ